MDGQVTDTITFEVTATVAGSPLDVSGATSKKIRLIDREGTVIELTADFKTDGVDGVVQKKIDVNVLVTEGVWKIQAVFAWADGSSYHTAVGKFELADNIPEPTP